MNPWLNFIIACLLGLFFLLTPGLLIINLFNNKKKYFLYLFSPVISIQMISCLSIIYQLVGIHSTWICLVLLPCFILTISNVISYLFIECRKKKDSQLLKITKSNDIRLLIIQILLSITVCIIVFILPLDGPSSFNQDADNTWHLSLIKSFATSGQMSPLSTSLFRGQSDIGETFFSGNGSFYPSVIHCLAALVVTATGFSVPLALNAILAIFISIILPVSSFTLYKMLFYNNYNIRLYGSISTIVFGAYPWAFLVFGPLYPNLAGMSLVPYGLALLLNIFGIASNRLLDFKQNVFLLVACLWSSVFTHTNTVFSLALLAFPAFLYTVYIKLIKYSYKSNKYHKDIIIMLSSILLFAIAWISIQHISLFSSVFNYRWDPYATPQQQLINILTLAYRLPYAQLFLSICVLLGIVRLAYMTGFVWVIASYFITSLFLFVNATTNGVIKTYLTGFWYNDPYRVAATLAIVGSIIAAVGLNSLGNRISVLLVRNFTCLTKKIFFTKVLMLLVFTTILLYPSFDLPGYFHVSTAFGSIEEKLTQIYDSNKTNFMDPAEVSFTKRVSQIVNVKYKILNNAEDGSVFSYALYGLNLCYRRSGFSGDGPDGSLLRSKINRLSTDKEVQSALTKHNIKYLLILDQGGDIREGRWYYGYYNPSDWSGYNLITDSTPGLKILLSEGDMRLYEIESFE